MYVDSSVIMGMTGEYDEGSKGFGKLQYMVCRPENEFFPDLSKVAHCCQCISKEAIQPHRQSRRACIGLLAQQWHLTAAGEKLMHTISSLCLGLHSACGIA